MAESAGNEKEAANRHDDGQGGNRISRAMGRRQKFGRGGGKVGLADRFCKMTGARV